MNEEYIQSLVCLYKSRLIMFSFGENFSDTIKVVCSDIFIM